MCGGGLFKAISNICKICHSEIFLNLPICKVKYTKNRNSLILWERGAGGKGVFKAECQQSKNIENSTLTREGCNFNRGEEYLH